MEGPLLASAVRKATTNGPDTRSTVGDTGALLILDITKAPATAETLTVSVQAKDQTSGEYVTLTAFAASKKGEELTEGGTLAYTLYPGAAETAAVGSHELQALPIPRSWRAVVTHSSTGEWTYSLSYQPLS